MSKMSLRGYIGEIEGFLQQGQFDKVIVHCKYILEIYPKHIATYRLLGQAFLDKKEFENSADLFERVLAVIPDDLVAQKGLSKISEAEGNLDAAIWHMERAFEVQPSDKVIQDELRRLYGRRDGIEPPKIRLTKGALVRMYARGDLFSQAIFEILDVLTENPHRSDLEVILAQLYYDLGKYEDAQSVCSKLLDQLPYCFEANRIISDILINTQHEKDAVEYFQRIEAIDPYARYISINHPTSDQVPDDTVMIDVLEDIPVQTAKIIPGSSDDIDQRAQPTSIQSEIEVDSREQLSQMGDSTGIENVKEKQQSFEKVTGLKVGTIEPTELPDWTVSPSINGVEEKPLEDSRKGTDKGSEDQPSINKDESLVELPEWFEREEQEFGPPKDKDDDYTRWQREYRPEDQLVEEMSLSEVVDTSEYQSIYQNELIKEDPSDTTSKTEEFEGTATTLAENETVEEWYETSGIIEDNSEPILSDEQQVIAENSESVVPDWMGDTEMVSPELHDKGDEIEVEPAPDWARDVDSSSTKKKKEETVDSATDWEKIDDSDIADQIPSDEIASHSMEGEKVVEATNIEPKMPKNWQEILYSEIQAKEVEVEQSEVIGQVSEAEIVGAADEITGLTRKEKDLDDEPCLESEIGITQQQEDKIDQEFPLEESSVESESVLNEKQPPEWVGEILITPEAILIEDEKKGSASHDSSDINPEWIQQIDVIPDQSMGDEEKKEFESISLQESEITGKEEKERPIQENQKHKTKIDQTDINSKNNELVIARKALHNGEIDKALELYNKMIAKTKNLETIIEDLENGLVRYPDDVDVMQSLGDAYSRSDRLQDALDIYNRAVELLD